MAAQRYVAFLRAVNVGKRRVEMVRLRAALEDLGHRDVSTYINSGNAIFTATQAPKALIPAIEAKLADEFGFEIPTVLRTADEVAAIAARQPFGAIPDGHTHMVVLLRQAPPPEVAAALEALSGDTDRLVVEGTEVHWHITGKLMDSGLKDRDWKVLGPEPSTTRNQTMLAKLAT